MLDMLPHWITRSLNEPTLTTNRQLTDKVSGKTLKPYFGSSVVFELDDGTKACLRQMQDKLYSAAGQMLAEPLAPESFHMTLHPLIEGADPAAIRPLMDKVAPIAHGILDYYKTQLPNALEMRTATIFNMAHTSLVLGLYPTESPGHNALSRMYSAFQQIPEVRLGYKLTPHITLAYFRPGTYTEEDLKPLRRITGVWTGIPITLSMKNLVYQEFTDMNHYTTVAP